jgi:hypothetical protein
MVAVQRATGAHAVLRDLDYARWPLRGSLAEAAERQFFGSRSDPAVESVERRLGVERRASALPLERAVRLCLAVCMTSPLQHFPDLGGWSDEEVRAAGYERRCVSVFDHWLSPEEAAACELFTFEDAASAGVQYVYEEQQARFVRFYQELFGGGVFRRTGPRWRQIGVVFHSQWDRRLKKAVQSSLRDRKHMDAYVPQFSLRVAGNWDRTDVLLFRETGQLAAVSAIAARHGLFIL